MGSPCSAWNFIFDASGMRVPSSRLLAVAASSRDGSEQQRRGCWALCSLFLFRALFLFECVCITFCPLASWHFHSHVPQSSQSVVSLLVSSCLLISWTSGQFSSVSILARPSTVVQESGTEPYALGCSYRLSESNACYFR